MSTIEQHITRSITWLGQTWERLAQPTSAARRAAWETDDLQPKSRWSTASMRLFLSRQGVALSRLMRISAPPIRQETPDSLELYQPPGVLQERLLADRSTSWNQPPERHGHWSAPPFRVTLSQTGQLAGAASASEHAKPGELDRFIEQVRLYRRAGFYQADVFQQARELLRQPAQP